MQKGKIVKYIKKEKNIFMLDLATYYQVISVRVMTIRKKSFSHNFVI